MKSPISRLQAHLRFTLGLLTICVANLALRAQPAPFEDLDAYVVAAMADWRVPGLALAIVDTRSILYEHGYGVLMTGSGEPVDPHSVFAVASNSKAFTATALGMLVSDEKLAWDDPVVNYLEDFRLYDSTATQRLTVRDLLCHRTGLATYGGDLTWYGSIYNRNEVLRRVRYQEPAYEFRTGYGYCNLLFLAAGEVLEAASGGTTWDEFLRERFFGPLGMKRSTTSVKDLAGWGNVAQPHLIRDDRVMQVPYVNVDNIAGAAAINSSAHDMAQWLHFQLRNGVWNDQRLIADEALMETRTPHNLRRLGAGARERNPFTHFSTYGLGWVLTDYRGHLLVSHTGGLDGMFSATGFLPGVGVGVVILTNLEDHSLMVALQYDVLDRYLGVEFVDWNERYLESRRRAASAVEASPQSSDTAVGNAPVPPDLAGRYRNTVYGDARITPQDDWLKIELLAHPHVFGRLIIGQGSNHKVEWSSPVWKTSNLVVSRNEAGEVVAFTTSVRRDWIDTLEYRFEKIAL